MKKEDRLIPMISLILYYGTEPWCGAKDLKELLQTDEIPEELLVLIRNYPMNLIQVRDIDYLEKFQTDLHETFGLIKYQHDSGKLTQFKLKCKTKEGNYDMCKALDDWEKQNIQQGERINAIQNARMFFRNGASLELVAASILVLSKEEVEEIYKKECTTL